MFCHGARAGPTEQEEGQRFSEFPAAIRNRSALYGPSRKFGGAELLSFVKRMYLGRSAAGIGSNPLAVAECQVSERT